MWIDDEIFTVSFSLAFFRLALALGLAIGASLPRDLSWSLPLVSAQKRPLCIRSQATRVATSPQALVRPHLSPCRSSPIHPSSAVIVFIVDLG